MSQAANVDDEKNAVNALSETVLSRPTNTRQTNLNGKKRAPKKRNKVVIDDTVNNIIDTDEKKDDNDIKKNDFDSSFIKVSCLKVTYLGQFDIFSRAIKLIQKGKNINITTSHDRFIIVHELKNYTGLNIFDIETKDIINIPIVAKSIIINPFFPKKQVVGFQSMFLDY